MAYGRETQIASRPASTLAELIDRRDFETAEKLAQERLSKEPGSAEAHYGLGVIYHFQGKIGSAIESLRKALATNPRHTDAAICLSVILNDIGRYEDAKKVFSAANQSVTQQNTSIANEIDKKFAIKHLEIADLYFRYRRYDEAIDEYTRALLLDPGALEIVIRRAKSYAKKGYLTRAIQELQRLRDEHPRYSEAAIQVGLLQYSQGNLLDAELEWESVLKLDPANERAKEYLEMAKKQRCASH